VSNTTPTNPERVARVRRALDAYKLGEPGPGENAETIIDLLTDLHHLLDAQGQADPAWLLDSWLRVAHDLHALEMTS
jgi:hypothetical protein